MKQKFLIFAALAALVAGLTACNKQETPASGDSQKQDFVMENRVVDIALSKDKTTASITFNEIRFGEAMPLDITLIILDVPVTVQGESIRFNWNDPENPISLKVSMKGIEVPYTDHKLTSVKGAIEPDPKDGTKKTCNFDSIAFVANKEGKKDVTISFQGNLLEDLKFQGTFRAK